MTLTEIKKICKENNVRYHHHDEFEEPPYKNLEGCGVIKLQDAIIIVYSSQYGSWQLAINKDGSVVTASDVSYADKLTFNNKKLIEYYEQRDKNN